MKNDNELVNANTSTGTSSELKLSFTIEHMTLLLMVYDGMRQIEDNLLQITGDLDNTDPESALGKLAMIDTLLEHLSPLYASMTSSGKKMSSLDWDDADNLYTCILDNIGDEYEKCARDLMRSTSINLCDQSNIVDSVPFTKDHMIMLLTIHDGMLQFQDQIREVVNVLGPDVEGCALWKIRKLDDLFNSLSPLYDMLLPSGKTISDLDWEDPGNIYALTLEDYGGDMVSRGELTAEVLANYLRHE
ncbi:MAG: hypothetical protein Q4D71_13635, partial [Oscillospiraceae bacterium]|nr:hypothetical protein [Oscillospiraceae bacterium]